LANDPEVTKFSSWSPHESLNITQKWIENNIKSCMNRDYYSWGIVLKAIKEPIGSISVNELNEKINMVQIGYCIGKMWWKQGYANEAFLKIIKILFEEVHVNRIEARHDIGNFNSGKVMIKAGLKHEGTCRQASWNNYQGICDCSLYAILAEDYFKNK